MSLPAPLSDSSDSSQPNEIPNTREKKSDEVAEAAENSTPIPEPEGLEMILEVCKKHLHRFGRPGLNYRSLFATISNEVTAMSGTRTIVQPILENFKQNIIKTLSVESDPTKRARLFSEMTKNFTVFDFVEPRDVKKKNYVPTDTISAFNVVGKSQKNSRKKQPRKTYPQAYSVARRNKITHKVSGQFFRPTTNGFRGNMLTENRVDWTQNNFSLGNCSDRADGSGRREIRAVEGDAESAQLSSFHRSSTYSVLGNREMPCEFDEGTQWSGSVVPRSRPRVDDRYGEVENVHFNGTAPFDLHHELFLRYENVENQKLTAIRKMHTEVIQEMRTTNELLELLINQD